MNEVGRYILYSIRDLEAKKFCLVFPEGKGIIRGWALLVEKLHFLRVSTLEEGNASSLPMASLFAKSVNCLRRQAKGSYAEVAKAKMRGLGEVIWMQLGDKEV